MKKLLLTLLTLSILNQQPAQAGMGEMMQQVGSSLSNCIENWVTNYPMASSMAVGAALGIASLMRDSYYLKQKQLKVRNELCRHIKRDIDILKNDIRLLQGVLVWCTAELDETTKNCIEVFAHDIDTLRLDITENLKQLRNLPNAAKEITYFDKELESLDNELIEIANKYPFVFSIID